MNDPRLPAMLIVLGAVVAIIGLALVSVPAAVIASGLCLAALGLDERRRP